MKKAITKIKKPNGFIYLIVYLLIYPFLLLFFRLRVDRKGYKPPKGPFIMLSNHVSFMDFVVVMLAAYPRRLNALTAQKFFFYRPLDFLLPMMGCIPKSLFEPDVRSVKELLYVLKRGGRVLIFPEGRCSTDGEYAGIIKSTGKLLKKLGVPVISCRVEGAYNCMPFWRKGVRFGAQRLIISNLFSAEDTKTLSVDELNDRIDKRLSGAEGRGSAPLTKLRVFGKRNLTEGLQNILYQCPKCGREFTMVTEKNIIRCTACGNGAFMDKYGEFSPIESGTVPENVHKWYKEQVMREMRFVGEDMEPLEVEVDVKMSVTPGNGLTLCGRGVLKLDRKGWRYDGELKGEEVSLFFHINTVQAIPFDPNKNFQIYSNRKFYAFTPVDDARTCVKYAVLGECVYRRFANPMQMTDGYDSGFGVTPQAKLHNC